MESNHQQIEKLQRVLADISVVTEGTLVKNT